MWMEMRGRNLRKEANDELEQNKALVRRYFSAYDTGDPDAVLKFVAANHVYHPPGGGKSLDFAGRKRDEAFFSRAFSRIHTIVEDQVAEGDKVVSRVTMEADHTGKYQKIQVSGRRAKFTFIDIARIVSEKIVEEWTEFDMMSILQQLQSKDNGKSEDSQRKSK
jgi:predicted ester cyclase